MMSFLDRQPFDATDPNSRELLAALMAVYDQGAAVRELVMAAGLRTADYTWSAPMAEVWPEILRKAAGQGMLRALITVVARDPGSSAYEVIARLAAERPPAAADGAELGRLYNGALEAYHTERWDEAISLFQAIASRDSGYRDVRSKLEQAQRQQQAAATYATARAAADVGAWEDAIRDFQAVLIADPGYRDVETRLAAARRQREAALLRAEARRLHGAGEWEAVVAVGEKLGALGPDFADADGLVTEARYEISTRARADDLASGYNRALGQLDAGEWLGALRMFEEIAAAPPGYRETERLADRARRQLCEAVGLIERPALVYTLTPDTESPFGEIGAVKFSLDAQSVALLAHGEVWVFSAVDGTERSAVRLRSMSGTMALSADGSRLAFGDELVMIIWDTATREVVMRKRAAIKNLYVTRLAFSPVDSRLAVVRKRVKGVQIWDTNAARVLFQVADDQSVSGLLFSPDGRKLATTGRNGTRVWDAANGGQLLKSSCPGAVLAFSSDSRYFATADGSAARIWHAASGRQIQVVMGDGQVRYAAFGPDGSWFATATVTGPAKQSKSTLRIWDTATGAQLMESSHRSPEKWAAFSADGSLAATISRYTARIWRLREPAND